MASRNKIVINGTMGDAGIETWSCGLTFSSPPPAQLITDPIDLGEWADDVMAIFGDASTESNELLSLVGSVGTIASVSAYYYTATGPAQAVGISSVPAITGTGNAIKPPQTSIVFSLLTGLAGRSFRGRIYWPAQNVTLTTGLTTSTATAQLRADAMAVTVGKIRDAAFGEGVTDLAVYSATRDVVTPVTRIGVGTVVDTQRRRRDGVPEVYAYADYVPGG